MLKLLRCEFAKLKRKPLFFAAAAISALIPLGCALFLPEMQEFSSGAEAVDRLMSTLFQLSAYLLLMPAVVVLASNLLFEEQDNDTLKNLMTVPVSKPALALAKMTLLFLFSIAFMAVGGLVNLATTLEREAGSTIHITCSLSLENGEAAVFLRSGADDPTILLSESGEYDGTVEVDGTSTYIGVWGDQADGTVSIEVE